VIKEFQHIVEYSFISKPPSIVARFLEGNTYSLAISDLPQNLKAKKISWDECYLSEDNKALCVKVGKKDIREIPAYMFHARGREI